MIRRVLLIAAATVALSAAAAKDFTPALARTGREWTRGIRTAFGITLVPRSSGSAHAKASFLQPDDEVQGTFCPVRPPVDEPTALLPDSTGARMSADPHARRPIESSSAAAGESLLPPAPALCRPGSTAIPMQNADGR